MLSVVTELKTLGLVIKNYRGLGYDNGSNMRGYYKGVKSRILSENPLVFFTPCGCHSWNLLLWCCIVIHKKAKFLGHYEDYTLFSVSSDVSLKKKIKTNITLT